MFAFVVVLACVATALGLLSALFAACLVHAQNEIDELRAMCAKSVVYMIQASHDKDALEKIAEEARKACN